MNVVGSLFSGIGGLDHGLRQAGWEHAFLCESNEWRRGVLRARFPGVPVYDDVRAVGLEPATRTEDDGRSAEPDGAGWLHAGTVPDLLCGGFPCQDVSVAGRRAGLAGERSGLFHEFARIAEAVRPRWLLVENVPGLLSSNGGRDFGVVLGTLADLGYGVAWRILDSRFFGVPQRRRRVFIVGTLADGDPRAAAERAGQVLAVGTRRERHPATGGKARTNAAASSVAGTLGGRRGFSGDDIDRGGRTSLSGLGSDGLDSDGLLIAGPLGGGNDGIGRRSEDDPNLIVGASVRRLTPTECERLQALPDDWTKVPDSAPDSRRYAALGDAVTATVAEWIGRRIMAAT